MNKQFTPGPWVLAQSNMQGDILEFRISSKAGRVGVAYTVGFLSPEEDEYSKANAALIAAAPDMYEALKLAKEIIEETDWDVCGPSPIHMEIINAALSKANPRP